MPPVVPPPAPTVLRDRARTRLAGADRVRLDTDLVTVRDRVSDRLSERLRDRVTDRVTDRVRLEPSFSLAWPDDLWAPGNTDPRDFGRLGTPQVYDLDWTDPRIGVAQADRVTGALHVAASSPRTSGAVDGSVFAGIGIRKVATHRLSRVGVQPDLTLVARYRWKALRGPSRADLAISTSLRGDVLAGGYVRNPVSGAWETVPTSPWRRVGVFRDDWAFAQGSHAETVRNAAWDGTGAEAQVLLEGGRTYLLAVVVRLSLTVTVEDSGGRPVVVADGDFDTGGSLTGTLSSVRLTETVFQP